MCKIVLNYLQIEQTVVVVVVAVSSTPSDANSFSSWEVNAFAALDYLTESLLTKKPNFSFNTFSAVGKLRIRRYPLLSGIGPTRPA